MNIAFDGLYHYCILNDISKFYPIQKDDSIMTSFGMEVKRNYRIDEYPMIRCICIHKPITFSYPLYRTRST
jgi:hypothetical protein